MIVGKLLCDLCMVKYGGEGINFGANEMSVYMVSLCLGVVCFSGLKNKLYCHKNLLYFADRRQRKGLFLDNDF